MFKRTLTLSLLLTALLPGAHAETLQDPTRPSYFTPGTEPGMPGQSAATPSLVLNAIRVAPNRRSALINDRSVKVGDRIGDARVIAIDRSGVRLLRGTEQFTLQLLPIKVKQAPKAARR